MSNAAPKPFPFLELPPEIREKIYILICHQSAPISLHLPFPATQTPLNPPPETSFPHALLQTCTLIYNELRLIYFTHNSFLLCIRRRNDDWSYFLSPSFLSNRSQIRSLKIIIYRFGSHDFFTKSFIPILEDAILNGRLRDLEVIVKEAFLRGAKHCEGALKGGFRDFAGCETHWVALRRVMVDPYLERRRLRSGNLDMVDMMAMDETEGGIKLNDITWMLGDISVEQSKAYGERIRG